MDETEQLKAELARLRLQNSQLLRENESLMDHLYTEEVVDGLIDLCVVAIGTLDALGVDPYRAWDEVHKANM